MASTRAPGPYTRADLEHTPDDGRRYEVIDGHLHPLLMVEVISPATREVDTQVKWERLQRAEVPSYWVVDPEDEVSLVAWELGPDGLYQQVAKVVGDQPFAARLPFPVTVVPAELVR